jgi:glycerophosphoryl diester phosphodiesterase
MAKLFLMLSALSFLACKVTENKPVPVPVGFDWQGHRGCRGLMPENSIPAFLHALDFPSVVTLELDLAVSKDNQLIVSHDPFFNPDICLKPDGSPVTKENQDKWLLYQRTTAEIQAFDCGSVGNPRFPEQQKIHTYKPTFQAVVEAAQAKNPAIHWNIEIKSQPDWDGLYHPPVADFVRLVVAELRQLHLEKQVVVQSFDVRALEQMHQQAPDIALAYLVENMASFPDNIAKLSFLPEIYSPYYLTVSRKTVRQCHGHHMKLIPWTVNDVSAMRRLVRLGVDGIITDYPDKIEKVGR